MAKSQQSGNEITPGNTLLLNLFKNDQKRLARFLLTHTYFINPDKIRRWIAEKGTAVVFPDCVRTSREHHPGKGRGHSSRWRDRPVKVCDNTKARLAFARLSGLVLSGNRHHRVRGYHVAHVWERVFDPEFFTAAWNLCLMPGFLKLSTESQDQIPLLRTVIQQASFDTYFGGHALGVAEPKHVKNPGIDLSPYLHKSTLQFV